MLLAVLQVQLHREPGSSYPPEQTYTRKSDLREIEKIKLKRIDVRCER